MNTQDRNEVMELLNAVQGSAARALRHMKAEQWNQAAQAADDAAGWAADANKLLLAEYVAKTGQQPWYAEKTELYRLTHGGAA